LKHGLDSNIGSLIDECKLIRSKFKGRQKITMLARLVIRGVVWHIWEERNARVFQQRSTHKITVFRTLYEEKPGKILILLLC